MMTITRKREEGVEPNLGKKTAEPNLGKKNPPPSQGSLGFRVEDIGYHKDSGWKSRVQVLEDRAIKFVITRVTRI